MKFLRPVVKSAAIVLGICFSAYLASLVYVISFSFQSNLPEHADAILILGAKVNLDNSPSQTLYQRTMQAVALYDQYKATYIITTGGVGLGPKPEATVSKDIATQNGIPEDKILADINSHDTFENVGDAKQLAQTKDIKSVIVVSDRFHVARGVLVARHFGFNPVYWDFPSGNYYSKESLFKNYAREAIAIIFYLPKLIF